MSLGETILNVVSNMDKEAKGDNTDLVFGTVSSINPLKIKIENRLELDERFLILSALVKHTEIGIPDRYNGIVGHSHICPEGPTSTDLPSMVLWRGLKVGDKVRMLRVNQGQTYYVVEREEGIL